jgi:hypothetical protein
LLHTVSLGRVIFGMNGKRQEKNSFGLLWLNQSFPLQRLLLPL